MSVKRGFFIFLAIALAELAASPQSPGQELGRICCFDQTSGSMRPTLQRGERFAALKYAQPVKPDYGDVIVFRVPKIPSVLNVKRVIGLPSDRIQMIDGAVHLNGKAIMRERIEDLHSSEEPGVSVWIKRWQETMPNGTSYQTLDMMDNGFFDNTPVYEVPEGHFFVMGDNRDHSTDSRALSQVGYIPAGDIIGRATSPTFLEKVLPDRLSRP